jgi:hypothetical protein
MHESYREWQEEVADGVVFFVDFRFASRKWLDEFQREICEQDHLEFAISYGPTFAPFPRPVRMYFPLYHDEIPLYPNVAPREELSDIYRAKREDRERQEVAMAAKRAQEDEPIHLAKRNRVAQEDE